MVGTSDRAIYRALLSNSSPISMWWNLGCFGNMPYFDIMVDLIMFIFLCIAFISCADKSLL